MKLTNLERRALESEVRVSAAGGQTAVHVQGYAAVFNSRSADLGGFVEVISPRAFNDVLADEGLDCRALIDHLPHMLLGRMGAGTLRLSVDERGLAYEIDMPDTSYSRDLQVSLARGDINKSSFTFRCAPGPDGQTWERRDGTIVRTVKRVELLKDISVVTFPAYDSTQAEVAQRSLQDWERSARPLKLTNAQRRLRLAGIR